MDFVIKNARVLIDGELKTGLDVGVTGDRISDIGRKLSCSDIIDAKGDILSPGFVDIHMHGNNGYSSMEGYDDIIGIAKNLPRYGVTSFLPASMSVSLEKHVSFVDDIKKAISSEDGARVLGCNMESPFLYAGKKGSHDENFIIPAKEYNKDWDDLISSGVVELMTAAPQDDVSLELIKSWIEKGITVSLGHTNADYKMANRAFDIGVHHVTHLFNAMNSLHHREPGTVGAALDAPNVYVELIADKIHLHPAILRMVAKIKGVGHTVLITDSMMAAGLTDGDYTLGGQKVSVIDGAARIASGALAGSTLTMDRAVKNMVECQAASLEDALSMATATPADAIDNHSIGRIKVGNMADLILIDDDVNIKKVIIGGKK